MAARWSVAGVLLMLCSIGTAAGMVAAMSGPQAMMVVCRASTPDAAGHAWLLHDCCRDAAMALTLLLALALGWRERLGRMATGLKCRLRCTIIDAAKRWSRLRANAALARSFIARADHDLPPAVRSHFLYLHLPAG